MTVIAVRSGVMAADSGLVLDGYRRAEGTKIRRMPDGSLVGICGDWISSVRLPDFLATLGRSIAHDDLVPFDDAAALHLRRNGYWLLQGGERGGVTRLKGAFFVEGSGSIAALAAMELGADARTAAKIACKIDTLCSGPVVAEELAPKKRRR